MAEDPAAHAARHGAELPDGLELVNAPAAASDATVTPVVPLVLESEDTYVVTPPDGRVTASSP